MIRPGAIFALLGLSPLFGCGQSTAPPSSVSLPGFSIELPAGRVTKTSDNPQGGVHAIELPFPSAQDLFSDGEVATRELEVHWSQNRLSQELWHSILLPAVMAQMPGAPAEKTVLSKENLSDSSWLTMVHSRQGNVGVGVVNCSETLAVSVTYVRYTDLKRQSRALRDILACARNSRSSRGDGRPSRAPRQGVARQASGRPPHRANGIRDARGARARHSPVV